MVDKQSKELRAEEAMLKVWKTPRLRTTVPLRRTAGGVGNANDQDDAFYTTS